MHEPSFFMPKHAIFGHFTCTGKKTPTCHSISKNYNFEQCVYLSIIFIYWLHTHVGGP